MDNNRLEPRWGLEQRLECMEVLLLSEAVKIYGETALNSSSLLQPAIGLSEESEIG